MITNDINCSLVYDPFYYIVSALFACVYCTHRGSPHLRLSKEMHALTFSFNIKHSCYAAHGQPINLNYFNFQPIRKLVHYIVHIWYAFIVVSNQFSTVLTGGLL